MALAMTPIIKHGAIDFANSLFRTSQISKYTWSFLKSYFHGLYNHLIQIPLIWFGSCNYGPVIQILLLYIWGMKSLPGGGKQYITQELGQTMEL